MTNYADLMFTDAVLAEQAREGSAGMYDSRYDARPFDGLGEAEREFLAARDSIYIASVSQTGWPYIQHRGGPRGFLKVTAPDTVAFADYRGNRQLITKGNLAGEDRVSIFAMDYARKARLKLQGHGRLIDADDDPALADTLATDGQGRVQRLMILRIAGFDWNCPQFITPRFTTDEMTALIGPELTRLEAENAALRAQLADRNAP
ncbi:pyridoxamine 5'-phosphate oxidase family protein [Sulfitobacter albidus]|uniref:Pyridoxamine 5'-phosphate oxidase family protein n=1 Tax=Sulfitobacter albidus TaxID=2829501 RepID=A0A975JBI0_9RHOB|nr:pyridoxamine 5'-phosphate oxidase family protein [Sulfitobacter albidus]QUJ75434.1 pyridoxamine 5'-phosphate oxidase family protein [Sulfitobacter albidus]